MMEEKTDIFSNFCLKITQQETNMIMLFSDN